MTSANAVSPRSIGCTHSVEMGSTATLSGECRECADRFARAAEGDCRGQVTTRRQLHGGNSLRRSAATVGNIVSYIDGSSSQRRRAVVAVFLAFWTILVAAEWALPGTEAAPAHGPHPLASAVGAPVAVQLDHQHISLGGIAPSPESFAEAVLRRGTVTLIALALVSALAVLPALWRYAPLAPIRGPPRSPVAQTGRVVLVRLCIARR